MSRVDSRGRLSDDARFELALVAGAHERKNRPRGILIIAAVVLLLMALFAGYGVRAQAAARAELRTLAADEVMVERLADEWTMLDALARDPGSSRVGPPITNLFSRMEDLAARAGIEKPRPPRVQPGEPRGAIRSTQYHYTDISHPELPPLLEWLRLAQGDELGMEIIGLTLRPDPNNWKMTVSFRRWESEG